MTIKNVALKIDKYTSKYWGVIFTFFIIFLSYIFIKGFLAKEPSWIFYHIQIFTLFLLYFTITTLGITPKPIYFILIFLFQEIFAIDDYLYPLSNWFFYQSPFTSLTQNIAAKDLNVFMLFIFVFLLLINIIKITYFKIKYNKWNFQSFFTSLTIGAILLITFVFHYILIEKNYKYSINSELNKMEQIFDIKNTEQLSHICEFNNYYCYIGVERDTLKMNHPEMTNVLNNIQENQIIKGNYLIVPEKNSMYLIVKKGNSWIINMDASTLYFKFNETWLMFGLTIAHGFWLLFYIWLSIFHYQRVFSKKKLN